MIRLISVLILSMTLAACNILDPFVYKLPKQQGNITEYSELDKLEIGMNKAQVKFIMGTPMASDTFNKNRWDYAYTYKSPGGEVTTNNLTLHFKDGKLSKIEGSPLVKRKDEEAEKVTGQS